MASIEKMQIRGIRAFSPNRDETIEFYSPLTMIVGANGCGKTSIIECLKYSVTGSLPPNSGSGQSFINDPTMTDAAEVKASIKLRFLNKAGNPAVVNRSLQLTKKKTKLEFKTLDGVIRMANERGEKISLSQKCSELDKHIPELIGVSAPIMENVIFCHQEDSNWPLQEGATLKKKFDDIFESSRYSKALETIAKTKKEYNAKTKDLKVEVAQLTGSLNMASDTRHSLEANRAKEEQCDEELNRVEEQIGRCQDKLNSAQATHKQLQRRHQAYRDQQANYSNLVQTLTSTRKNLEQELPDSDAELTLKLHNFEEVSHAKSHEKVQLQRQIDRNVQSIRNAQGRVETLTTAQGAAASLHEQYDSLLKQDKNMLKIMSKKYDLPQVAEDKFLESLTAHVAFHKTQYTAKKQERDAAVSSLEKKLDVANADLQKLEIDLQSTEYQLTQVLQEKNAKQDEIFGLKSFLARNSNVKIDYDSAMRDYAEFQERYDANVLRLNQTKNDLIDRINRLDEQKVALQRTISELNAYRSERERLQAQEDQASRDMANCEAEMHVLSNRSRQLNVALPNSLKEIDGVLERLSNIHRQKRAEIAELSTQLNKKRDTLACCEAAIKSATENSAKAAEQRRQYEEYMAQYRADVDKLNQMRVDNSEEVVDIDEGRARVAEVCSDNVRGYLEAVAGLEGKKLFTSKLLRKSTQGVPAAQGIVAKCPCCDHNLNQNEYDQFQRNVVALFRYQEKSLDDADAKHVEAQELKVRLDNVIANLNSLENAVHDGDRNRTLLQENSQMKKELMREKDDCEARLTTLQEEVRLLDVCINDWRKLQERWTVCEDTLNSIQMRRSSKGSYLTQHDRNVQDCEDELAEAEKDIKSFTRQKDKCMEDITRLNQRHTELQSRKMEAERANMEYQQKDERLKEIQTRVLELEAQEGRLTQQKAALQRDRLQLQRLAADAKDALSSAKQTKDAQLQTLMSRCDDMTRDVDSLKAWIRDVSELRRKIEKSDINAISNEIAQLRQEMQALETTNSEIQPRINLIDKFINDQDHMKHLITSNLAYRDLRQQVVNAKQELEDVEFNNVENDIRAAEREIQRCEQDKQKLLNQKYSAEGSRKTLRETSAALEAKLGLQEYYNIDERCRQKNIEHDTTIMAVHDLDSYYSALDTALQRFHSLKIAEINKIIRELWQLIYRGGDIEMIELVSGVDDAVGRATRSYNYRVVMRKGDVPLDMRGRCSAGQRVLASIVIRLALAETFCVSCGILALDEPTTNLDDANKAGLAHALARIIGHRSRQMNFQLLCITHDEEFVRLMSTELSALSDFSLPEYYFRISRLEDANTGKYFSHIQRIPWEDM